MKATLIRVARSAVSLVIAGLAAKYADNPLYLAAMPLLAGLGKELRQRGFTNIPF